jgi:hypothetical protein
MLARLVSLVFLSLLLPGAAQAGAPFLTDDAGTLGEGGVELDLLGSYTHKRGEAGGVLPSLELDYGLTARVALHGLATNAFAREEGGGGQMGAGDGEVGLKYRFRDQDDVWPFAAAVYPRLIVNSGDVKRGLGAGHPQLFLPLWLARSGADWMVFGGGGYWINPSRDSRNFLQLGIGALRRLDPDWTFGGEIFHADPDKLDGKPATGFNLGVIHDFSAQHHLMLSAGRGIRNASSTNRFSVQLGYQWTR